MNWLRGSAGLLMLLSSSLSAQAASITVGTYGAANIVRIEGRIEFGDERIFNEKVRGLSEGTVVFESLGGSLKAGLEIGKTIRDAGLNTVVLNDETCASACALAWLGGKTRFASPRAQILFHAAWVLVDGEKRVIGPGNALVGAYLYSLGLRDRAIVYVTQAGPDEVKSLTFDDADNLGIQVTEFREGERTAMRDPPPAAPPSIPPIVVHVPVPAANEKVPPADWRPTNVAAPQLIDLASIDVAEQVQHRLQDRGYLQGVVDGVWGLKSRVALRTFKSKNGLGYDDAWDLRTQSALFDDGSAMWSSYPQPDPAPGSDGLFKPFAPRPGATLHPLNPTDAAGIQAYLYRLNYYRKQGDGTWGKASRSALIDFKIANGLAANDTWDSSVEDALRRPNIVPATATPFGDWAQDIRICGDLSKPGVRMSVTAQSIEASGALCKLDTPLQRVADGWRGVAVCSRSDASEVARVHLQLANGRLLDRSQVGRVRSSAPATFSRCPALP